MAERTTRPPTGAEIPPPDDDRTTSTYTPETGDIVWDAAERKVGRVMGHVGPYWQLRLPSGGREWEAAGPLRPATAAERLSLGVALANARSRGETP
ncbi:hypothetical protein ACFWM5_06980 [Streptomyces bobili]|uniref:hypothetical protein n=1 Tax=Streptomyces bobili TaxID=67280 RepID=UPI00364AE2CF